MSSVNKVIIVGHLGQDPEARNFDNGGMIATLSIATSERWTDKNTGEKKEQTEWHRVVLNNKLADVAKRFLHKGDQIYIEGSLHTRKWTDQNTGQMRYSTEIRASSMQMLGAKGQQDSQNGGGAPSPHSAPSNAPNPAQPSYPQDAQPSRGPGQAYTPPLTYGAKVAEDDIPF